MKKLFLLLLVPLIFLISIVFSSLHVLAPIMTCLLVLGVFISIPMILYKSVNNPKHSDCKKSPYQDNNTNH